MFFVVHQPSFAQIRSFDVPFLLLLILIISIYCYCAFNCAVTVPQNANLFKSISYRFSRSSGREFLCNAVTILRSQVGR